MNNNFCENVRTYLKSNAAHRPVFTTKELGMALGVLSKSEVGSKTNQKVETKIGDELRRLRDPSDPHKYKSSWDTGNHSHLAYAMGFRIRIDSYKSKNSHGKRRPAIKWVCEPIVRSLESFMTDQKVATFPITANVPYVDLVKQIPDDILGAEIQRRLCK